MGIIAGGPSWGDVLSALDIQVDGVAKNASGNPISLRINSSVKYERGIIISQNGEGDTTYDTETPIGRWWAVNRLRIQIYDHIYDSKGKSALPSILVYKKETL